MKSVNKRFRASSALDRARLLGRPSVIDAQADAAMHGVADRVGTERAVDEHVRGHVLAQARADAAAQLEPMLVAEGGQDIADADHGGLQAGRACKGLHETAIDVYFDEIAEQVRPLRADTR